MYAPAVTGCSTYNNDIYKADDPTNVKASASITVGYFLSSAARF